MRKWVQSLEANRKKVLHQYFVDMHPYKKIFCYLVTRCHEKNVKFVEVLPKTDGSITNCANRNAIKPCTLKKFLNMIVCSCAWMVKFFSAPPDGATIEYKIHT